MIQKLKSLKTIHFGLILPLIALTGFALFMISSEEQSEIALEELKYVPGLLLMLALWIAPWLFKQHISKSVNENSSLETKAGAFMSAHLIKMSIFEAAALFGIVESIINGRWFNLTIVLIVILIFFANVPSVSKIAEVLQLTPEERNEINT